MYIHTTMYYIHIHIHMCVFRRKITASQEACEAYFSDLFTEILHTQHQISSIQTNSEL